MRDSALKPSANLTPCLGTPTSRRRAHARQRFETIKLGLVELAFQLFDRRRRAHARQRFETQTGSLLGPAAQGVGEELMRDSALKPSSNDAEPSL